MSTRADIERILLDRGWRLVVVEFLPNPSRYRYAIVPDWERCGWNCYRHAFWFRRLHQIWRALGLRRAKPKRTPWTATTEREAA